MTIEGALEIPVNGLCASVSFYLSLYRRVCILVQCSQFTLYMYIYVYCVCVSRGSPEAAHHYSARATNVAVAPTARTTSTRVQTLTTAPSSPPCWCRCAHHRPPRLASEATAVAAAAAAAVAATMAATMAAAAAQGAAVVRTPSRPHLLAPSRPQHALSSPSSHYQYPSCSAASRRLLQRPPPAPLAAAHADRPPA